ncbi:hypothetical protein MPLDJ20_220070 [Mesorhizobium plurifarium]|uniref:Uncharacterized protein n=1 Tax=Mesorhizobium plurifarium TaxID=69974 RepID=A0A090GM14_MESPL|nr:hypothetical protein MPLDJ20_220070 [Mesorhizobium plurifarium]
MQRQGRRRFRSDRRMIPWRSIRPTASVKTYTIDSVPVRIFDPAKSIVDCFRFRNGRAERFQRFGHVSNCR